MSTSNRSGAGNPGPLAAELRNALRACVTGVTVVTALGEDGELAGMTANSFTSVSLAPPLVLVCLARSSRSYGTVAGASRFTIHALADDQSEIALAFAEQGRSRGDICAWRVNERGFAVLDRSLMALECELWRQQPAGDHAILIGKVAAVHAARELPRPLVCHGGRLFGLGEVFE